MATQPVGTGSQKVTRRRARKVEQGDGGKEADQPNNLDALPSPASPPPRSPASFSQVVRARGGANAASATLVPCSDPAVRQCGAELSLPDRPGRRVLHGDPRELDPRRNPQLAEDLPQMKGDRVDADVLAVSDFLIAQPSADKLADRAFSVGQACPPDVGPSMSRPMPAPHPRLAQPPPDPGRVPGCSGTLIAVQRVVQASDRVRLRCAARTKQVPEILGGRRGEPRISIDLACPPEAGAGPPPLDRGRGGGS